MRIKMKAIPKPPEGTKVVLAEQVAPIMKGVGAFDYECGSCDKLLLQRVFKKQVRHLVFRCPKCGGYSEIR